MIATRVTRHENGVQNSKEGFAYDSDHRVWRKDLSKGPRGFEDE